jgi:hypothetical protein
VTVVSGGELSLKTGDASIAAKEDGEVAIRQGCQHRRGGKDNHHSVKRPEFEGAKEFFKIERNRARSFVSTTDPQGPLPGKVDF